MQKLLVIPGRTIAQLLGTVVVATMAVACNGAEPVGQWRLWSIDGSTPTAALPSRTELPAAVVDNNTHLNAGDVWIETTIDSAQLQFLEDGEFSATSFSRSVTAITAQAYARLSGRVASTDVLRERKPQERSETRGRWEQINDSLMLFVPREQVASELAAELHEMYPGVMAEDIKSIVEQSVTTDKVRWASGTQQKHRLALKNNNGRRRIYRRSSK